MRPSGDTSTRWTGASWRPSSATSRRLNRQRYRQAKSRCAGRARSRRPAAPPGLARTGRRRTPGGPAATRGVRVGRPAPRVPGRAAAVDWTRRRSGWPARSRARDARCGGEPGVRPGHPGGHARRHDHRQYRHRDGAGWRHAHFKSRSRVGVGRARIGRPARYRSRSSASAVAEGYLRRTSLFRHFRQIVSRSRGTSGATPQGADRLLLDDVADRLRRRLAAERRRAGEDLVEGGPQQRRRRSPARSRGGAGACSGPCTAASRAARRCGCPRRRPRPASPGRNR